MNNIIRSFFFYAIILSLLSCKNIEAQSFTCKIDYAFNRDLGNINYVHNGNDVVLKGQTIYKGLVVKNLKNTPQEITIDLDIPNEWTSELRKALPITTWYKGKSVIDPLVSIINSDNASSSKIKLKANETSKLILILKVPNNATSGNKSFSAAFENQDNEETSKKFDLNVLNNVMPIRKDFMHVAFTNVYNVDFDNMLSDLKDHYVNLLEFSVFPDVKFEANGNIQNINWSKVDRYLVPILRSKDIKPFFFWEPYYSKFNTTDGANLKIYSPKWYLAFSNLIDAFVKHIESLGYQNSDLVFELTDETHSGGLDDSKLDEKVILSQKLGLFFKKKFPFIRQLNTFSNNSQFKDFEAIYGSADLIVKHWPLPEKSSKFGNKLNPALQNKVKIIPFISKSKLNKSKIILNYHVSKGKSDNILVDEMLFPLFTLINGNNGIGWWAYNAYSGSSWNDKDSRGLDYSFIYNGNDSRAKSFLNGSNKENIIPSMRWLAVKGAMQNVFILKSLMTNSSKLQNSKKSELDEILNQYKDMLDNYGNPDGSKISFEKAHELSQRAITLWGNLNNL